jgi:hypothetical protein
LHFLTCPLIESNRLQGRFDTLAILLLVIALGAGLTAFVALIAWGKSGSRGALHVLVVSGLVTSCAYLLVGDYGVAVITGNTLGYPSEEAKTLYWIYWVFERLPLLTF